MSFPYMKFYQNEYLADTTHLTTIEHGAYMLLLMVMWRNGGSLPNDDAKLARYAKLTAGQWARIRQTILEFFEERDGHIFQGRLTEELEAVRQLSQRQSQNAKAKALKNNETAKATAEPPHCPSDIRYQKEENPLTPLQGECDDPEIVVSDNGVVLTGRARSRWLTAFDDDAEQLRLALIEVRGRIQPHSRSHSVPVQVERSLAAIVRDRRDRDRRYAAACDRNKRPMAASHHPENANWVRF